MKTQLTSQLNSDEAYRVFSAMMQAARVQIKKEMDGGSSLSVHRVIPVEREIEDTLYRLFFQK